jgi:sensory rhodopsin
MEELIFYFGILLFSITTTIFLLLKRKNPKVASINMIVNIITIASYILMVSKLSVSSAVNGELIYWTRWLFYAASCSFLMLEISLILDIENTTKTEIIIFNSLVMITGLFASITEGFVKWLFFALSSIAYIYVLYQINHNRTNEKFIVLFVAIFWSGFPVFWLLSPAGFMILDAFWTAIFYLLLDFITKVFFGFYTTLKYNKE